MNQFMTPSPQVVFFFFFFCYFNVFRLYFIIFYYLFVTAPPLSPFDLSFPPSNIASECRPNVLGSAFAVQLIPWRFLVQGIVRIASLVA